MTNRKHPSQSKKPRYRYDSKKPESSSDKRNEASVSDDRNPPMMLARCVFNSKANDFLIKDAKGLSFKHNDHGIHFHPVKQKFGKNIRELSWIGTEKRAIDVPFTLLDGQFADIIQKCGPYFVLHNEPNGWMRMEFMDKAPKNAAYGRVWATSYVEQPVEPVVDSGQSAVVEAKKHILAAVAVVHEYEMEKHIGRTPKKVKEARRLLSSFSAITSDIQLSKVKRGKHVH